MLQLVFDRAAIKQNIAAVKRRAGKADIYAVLTADGFGAGLVELANLLRDDGISRFAVTEVADVKALRRAGFVEEEILMLRSTADPDELNALLDLNAVCTVGSYETGVALNALAEARATVAVAHVLVDTGAGLGGFLPGEPEKLLSIYKYLSNVAIAGICTQLCDGNPSAQLDLFQTALDALHAEGLETGMTHAADSSALPRDLGLDAVQVGAAFLGRCRARRSDGLKNACHAEATLDTVRWLPKGHTVGGGRLIRLRRPTRVAVISAGTQSGFGVEPVRSGSLLEWLSVRRRSRKRRVRLDGISVRLLGGVGASETAIDVTDLKCTAGDVVTFDVDPLFARGMKRVYR